MELIESIAVGLLVGFFFYEWMGLSPGGFVVPGYLALYLDRPFMVLSTLVVSLVTYGGVQLLSRVTILYGRRRFILMILAGFAFQWLYKVVAIKTQFLPVEIDTIGFIIPGLIANEMGRQRILPTLGSLAIVTVLVRLILILIGYFKTGGLVW
jgi:poly-gamma-glutamate biosynthesis protein PgsC/CapC